MAGNRLNAGQSFEEESAGVSGQYQVADEVMQSLGGSRWIFRHTDTNALAVKRRDNYQAWHTATAGMSGCKALFPYLPADCIPYMFPLVLERPEFHFHALKRLGVPIWRWDDMAVSGCEVASAYRLKLIHLPCHQGLSSEQMRWMTTALGRVLSVRPTTETS